MYDIPCVLTRFLYRLVKHKQLIGWLPNTSFGCCYYSSIGIHLFHINHLPSGSSKDTSSMRFTSIRYFISLSYARRLFVVIFGLFLCSLGIVCTYRSGLGLGPWDVLHKGVSLHTPLTFGQASIATAAVVILIGLLIRIRPGVATILNMLLIGIFIDFQLRNHWVPDLSASPWPWRIILDVVGVFLMGLGTAFYITPRMGSGPRDGLMLRLHVLTRMRISIVRATIEL